MCVFQTRTCSQTFNGQDQVVTSCEPLVQVIPLRGPFMVSRKLAMKDEPNIGSRCSRHVQCSLVLPIKFGRSCSVKHCFTRFGPLRKPTFLFQRHTLFFFKYTLAALQSVRGAEEYRVVEEQERMRVGFANGSRWKHKWRASDVVYIKY